MSEGLVTIPESACCWGCGYSLRGLGENRCPECGRGFEPGDAWSYRTPGSGPGWAIWLARSPRKWMIWVYLCWAAVMLVACSVPGNWEPAITLAGVFAVVASGHWLLHVLIAVHVRYYFKLPTVEFGSELRRWTAWPLLVVVVVGLVLFRVPLYARFFVSLPWLEAAANRAGAPHATERWIGLFHVNDVTVEETGTYFETSDGVYCESGFVFCGRDQTPANSWRLWGRWRCYSRHWVW